MYGKFVSALYALNIILQAIITLLSPAALMFGLAWLLIAKCGAPEWLYAVLIPIGVLAGLISMVRFVIGASEGLERLEKEREANKRSNGGKGKK